MVDSKVTAQTPAAKTVAPAVAKKEPISAVQRVTETLKRAAIAGKINKDELDAVANLAGALKTFMQS